MTDEDLERKAIEFVHESFGKTTVNMIEVNQELLPSKFMGVFYSAGVECYTAGYKAALEEKEDERD